MPDRYYSYARYVEMTGRPQMRVVPLDLGLGCPHRTPEGNGGCTFCPVDGARAVQISEAATLEEQVQSAIDFAKRRYGAKRFEAYVQAYTGTFANQNEQRELYGRILELFPFSALSIGTRPDCLPPATITFIKEMQKRLEVSVQLGLQTSHDKTLERINRGHDWQCSVDAIQLLHGKGIPVIGHIILGLPGETQVDFNVTAERLAELPLDGLKIHNLHVLKGTALGEEYERKPFPVFNEFEYLEALMPVLRRLPPDLPLLRVTTDSPENELLAPRWHLSKGQFLELLNRHLAFRLWRQGDLYKAVAGGPPTPRLRGPGGTSGPTAVTTEDGSVTFWSPVFKEHYHTQAGAAGEASGKFVVPSRLRERLCLGSVRLLDVCFGLGYNSFAACEVARDTDLHDLSVTALEIDRGVVCDAAAHAEEGWRKCALESLFETGHWNENNASIRVHWGDARHTIKKAGEAGLFDVVYLDAFSTQRNSELWTVEFFRKIRQAMAPGAVLLTYCAALPVRAGLMEAGFFVGDTEPFGRERPGTIAALKKDLIERPLSAQERENVKTTTKGIPFRDPSGVASNREILKLREERVKAFKLNA